MVRNNSTAKLPRIYTLIFVGIENTLYPKITLRGSIVHCESRVRENTYTGFTSIRQNILLHFCTVKPGLADCWK